MRFSILIDKPRPPSGATKAIKQRRGRRTYDALIATGFKLLERHEFDTITIAALARSAGYSVGAFYARFSSKDEFFDALLAHHLEQRRQVRDHLVSTLSNDELVEGLIHDLATYYVKRRWFWRAALIRSIRDPEPLRAHAEEFADALVGRINGARTRPLEPEQERNVRYAFQVVRGTINNAIIYGAEHELRDRERFIEDLVRGFKLISDYDELMP